MATLAEKLAEAQKLTAERNEAEAREQTEKMLARSGIVYPVDSVLEVWPEIVSFSDTGKLPQFPLSIFPTWLRDNAEGVAESTQTPTDVAGLLILTILGIALTKKFEIELRSGWREPLNLWTVSAMPPGSRKSAVFRDVTSPVLLWEREERERLLPEIKRQENSRKVTEGRIQKLQQEAIKAKDMVQSELAAQEAAELAIELEHAETIILPKALIDDSTPEAVARIMAEQKGRIGVMSAEGGIFDVLNGRYQNGMPNLDVFLKGHAGDFLRVDRVGRESNFIESPALSLGLSIQPTVLEGLANKQGLRGRGLLARFLFGLPVSNVGYRNLRPQPVPDGVRRAYAEGVHALLGIPMPTEPYILRLSPEAEGLFRELEAWLEPKLRPFAELESIADWASKLAGATARVMGILHVSNTFPNSEVPIGAETTAKAIRLAKDYLVSHAKAAFSVMGADEQQEKAKKLLRWIEQKSITEFSRRQAHNELQGTFKKADELDAPLRILSERGFIRLKSIPDEGGVGRKPSPIYEINPHIAYTQSTKYTKSGVNDHSVDSVDSVEVNSEPENYVPVWLKGGVI